MSIQPVAPRSTRLSHRSPKPIPVNLGKIEIISFNNCPPIRVMAGGVTVGLFNQFRADSGHLVQGHIATWFEKRKLSEDPNTVLRYMSFNDSEAFLGWLKERTPGADWDFPTYSEVKHIVRFGATTIDRGLKVWIAGREVSSNPDQRELCSLSVTEGRSRWCTPSFTDSRIYNHALLPVSRNPRQS